MNPKLKSQLIGELKEQLKISVDRDDFASVERYASYIRELLGMRALPKRFNAPKAEKDVKVEGKKRGRKPGVKIAAKKTTAKGVRGRKPTVQIKTGTVLGVTYKGMPVQIKVAKEGYEYEGTTYGSLSQAVDVLAGKDKARHLRYLKHWKPVKA